MVGGEMRVRRPRAAKQRARIVRESFGYHDLDCNSFICRPEHSPAVSGLTGSVAARALKGMP